MLGWCMAPICTLDGSLRWRLRSVRVCDNGFMVAPDDRRYYTDHAVQIRVGFLSLFDLSLLVNESIVFIVIRVIKRTAKVITAEGSLEWTSFQWMLEWVDGWCRLDDIVRHCIPDLSDGNLEELASVSLLSVTCSEIIVNCPLILPFFTNRHRWSTYI